MVGSLRVAQLRTNAGKRNWNCVSQVVAQENWNDGIKPLSSNASISLL